MELIAFYLFAAMAVASALGVILFKNPVHAVLSLVLTFFSTACLFLLLQAEFLGVALVLVYVGAVMVLFLFVVMMLDINTAPLREGFARYLPVAATVAGLMFAQMLVLLGVTTGKRDVAFPSADPAALVRDSVALAVQVNGKLRATIEVAVNAAKEQIEALALAEPNVQKFMEGLSVKKVIVVPGKIVNIVAAP